MIPLIWILYGRGNTVFGWMRKVFGWMGKRVASVFVSVCVNYSRPIHDLHLNFFFIFFIF